MQKINKGNTRFHNSDAIVAIAMTSLGKTKSNYLRTLTRSFHSLKKLPHKKHPF